MKQIPLASTTTLTGDIVGFTLSIACAIHCLLLPIIAYSLPLFTQIVEAEWIHLTLLFILIPIAFTTLAKGRHTHQSNKPLLIGSLGITALIVGVLAESLLHIHQLEKTMTVVGSLLLCTAHLFNFGAQKSKTDKVS